VEGEGAGALAGVLRALRARLQPLSLVVAVAGRIEFN
jgi:hypothetical protein